jgi:hypothetical protein
MAESQLGVVEDKKEKPMGTPLSPVQEVFKENDTSAATATSTNSIAPPSNSTIAVALAVLILAVLFRSGWTNVLLVSLCSV